MSLSAGALLGPYEILAPLGAGGMGEVWKARDTRLDRVVAIKISHDRFSDRFTREAMAVAALNHPNICALYDVGPDYLVFEYIEGRPLKGPLPLNQSLRCAVQICDALSTAHKTGIVHRDLKPANILLTKSGVKLLDFGLAKLSRGREVAAGATTETIALTKDNTMLGTLQYMSPEQLECKDVDGRSDIFSFGAVLYEMVTGKRTFEGASQASVVAAILERDPPPLSSLEPVAPPALERVVSKCLAKDPDERWQSAKDLKDELQWIAGGTAEGRTGPGPAPRRRLLPWFAAVGGLAIAFGLTGIDLWRATRPVDHPLVRLSVDLGPDALAGINVTATISPDGRRMVFAVRGPDGKPRLATRLLDKEQVVLLPGTEYGTDPFFSPDGRWVGFFSSGKLKKISVEGGAPIVLCNASVPRGASWGEDGDIVLNLNQGGPLFRVSSAGGTPRALTMLRAGETSHRWPQLLAGGEIVLFTVSTTNLGQETANIEVLSLRTGKVKVVQRGGYYGRYLPSGHLVYVHQGVLFGVPFDIARLEVRGPPTPLLQDVAANSVNGAGQFDFAGAASGPGTLVYLAGKGVDPYWQVAWLDSSGKQQPLIAAPGIYAAPRFSPDGRKLAFTGGDNRIVVYALGRDAATRLTFDGSVTPVWTPDGTHIVFASFVGGFGLSWIRNDGSGGPRRLIEGQNNLIPWSFSPDSRFLAYYEFNTETSADIWVLPLETSDPDHPKAGKPEPFLRTPADERFPRFSPDGGWIAYQSDESGGIEIYVQPFRGKAGGKWQISESGGMYPLWSKNGRELFYQTPDHQVMVVDYRVDNDSFIGGKPRLWSEQRIYFPGGFSNLDLAPDGKRFAVLAPTENAGSAKGSVHVTFLENFFDELRRRIPTGGR
jgi:serine/threonine-protein kinase